jgi:hypothetical protein
MFSNVLVRGIRNNARPLTALTMAVAVRFSLARLRWQGLQGMG